MVIAADPAKTNIKTRIFIKLLSFCTIFVIKSFETKGVKLLREYERQDCRKIDLVLST